MTNQPWLGSWKLISCEGRCEGNVTENWYGEKPFGRLFYDASGQMCAFVSPSNRESLSFENPNAATPEEKAACFDRFLAYCGTYSFSEDGRVEHYVEGSFFLIGLARRKFAFGIWKEIDWS